MIKVYLKYTVLMLSSEVGLQGVQKQTRQLTSSKPLKINSEIFFNNIYNAFYSLIVLCVN